MRLSNPLASLNGLFNKTVELGYNGTTRKFRIESVQRIGTGNVTLSGTKLLPTGTEPRQYRLDRVESIKLI